jgi:hypothetical protein
VNLAFVLEYELPGTIHRQYCDTFLGLKGTSFFRADPMCAPAQLSGLLGT